MAFSTGNGGGGPMSEINVTPLVDVMLVLLIIFMITAPLMTHKVKVELPKATLNSYDPNAAQKVLPITITVKEDGRLYLNDNPSDKMQIDAFLKTHAGDTVQPPVNIRADHTTKYSIISEVVNLAQAAGMRKVGFVSTKER